MSTINDKILKELEIIKTELKDLHSGAYKNKKLPAKDKNNSLPQSEKYEINDGLSGKAQNRITENSSEIFTTPIIVNSDDYSENVNDEWQSDIKTEVEEFEHNEFIEITENEFEQLDDEKLEDTVDTDETEKVDDTVIDGNTEEIDLILVEQHVELEETDDVLITDDTVVVTETVEVTDDEVIGESKKSKNYEAYDVTSLDKNSNREEADSIEALLTDVIVQDPASKKSKKNQKKLDKNIKSLMKEEEAVRKVRERRGIKKIFYLIKMLFMIILTLILLAGIAVVVIYFVDYDLFVDIKDEAYEIYVLARDKIKDVVQ